MNTAVLILNLGTPAAPTPRALRDYYSHFFADPFVFDFSPLGRWALRNLIIKPFRAPKAARQYARIWMEGGSPLQVYTDRLRDSLATALAPAGIPVFLGWAYSRPFVADAMAQMQAQGIEEILVLPLYPQYSTATTESAFHAVRESARGWSKQPQLTFIKDLFQEPAFIRAWAIQMDRQLSQGDPATRAEHVIFSYHGLPERNIRKADEAGVCQFGACCDRIGEGNRYCYRAQCFATTRSIAQALGWDPEFYSVAFQSRFGKDPWIQPYLDEHIAELAARGVKRVAVATPSFVSDCLETLHEIGIEYHEQFIEAGGEDLRLIPNLNDEPYWFAAVADIARAHLDLAASKSVPGATAGAQVSGKAMSS